MSAMASIALISEMTFAPKIISLALSLYTVRQIKMEFSITVDHDLLFRIDDIASDTEEQISKRPEGPTLGDKKRRETFHIYYLPISLPIFYLVK